METARHNLTAPRERIIQGADGWWFLGPGGTAKLSPGHLGAGGRLRPETERDLRARGLLTAAAYRSYSLTVLTSTACNLGCGYCFQNTGQDGSGGTRPARIASARLRPETITGILEFTGRQMRRAGLDRLLLMLFGGEPLLNPRGCRELLRRAAGYGLAGASMTTNGVLLTPPLAEELAALGLSWVQVSFDGDRADHDKIRVTRAGGATFDAIVGNIARVSERTPIRWNLRVNVSHHNVGGIRPLVQRLAERLDPARCSLVFARVGDIGIGYGNDLRHTSDLAAAFAGWQRLAVDLGFAVSRPRPYTPCQACSFRDGRYGAVVSADGTISSCWVTAGRPEWAVGTVTGGYLPAGQAEARWTSCEASYQDAGDHEAIRQFHDQVDADLLDYLSSTGRLGH